MATIYEYILKLNSQMNGVDVANSALKKTDELANKAQSSVSGLGGKLKKAFSSIPGADFVTNPIVAAGSALVASGKMALDFDQAMAKVNTTAQMTPDKLKALKGELLDMGTKAGADLSKIPDAYEKILSQTGDVALSTDILRASLQGAKAGFTDQDVVAGALAQTLSLVGKENTNAQEVLDTMFAAKRVGAGEFKDFANYIPGLIASGKALGVGFKDTAGLFAFMTGKGQSAERSATLMENAFTALGKSEITKGLEGAGVDIFNADGSMKKMDVIFGQLQKKLATFGSNDKAKSNFLESIGLKDAQAKQAFMILSSDGAKLSEVLHDVSNAQGETATAFGLSANPMQNISMLWSQIQKIGIGFGGVLSAILVPAISGLLFILTPVVDMFSWLFTQLSDGNPIVWTIVAAISAYAIVANAAAIASGIATAATSIWTGAQWLLNAAMDANPIGLIIAAVALLIGIVYSCVEAYDTWGAALTLVLGPIGQIVNIVMALKNNWDSIKTAFTDGGIIGGLKRIGIVLLDAVLYPVQQLLGLLAKIPGMSKLAGGGEKMIADLRKSLDLVTPGNTANASNSANDPSIKAGLQRKAQIEALYKQYHEIDGKAGSNYMNQRRELADKINKIRGGAFSALNDNNFNGINDSKESGAGGGNGKGEKPNTEKVAAGGTRNTSITINLGKMVENIVFQGGLQDNAQDLSRQIEELLLRSLYAAQSAS